MIETLAHGYSSESTQRELSNGSCYDSMNTNMTGFIWFSKIFASLTLDEDISLIIRRFKLSSSPVTRRSLFYALDMMI